MTNPAQYPGTIEYAGQQVENESDAVDSMARVVTGNPNLITRPNLVAALVQGNATSAQAAMTNQFIEALKAENALDKIRRLPAGQNQMPLPTAMTTALDSIGVKYDDVNLTPEQEAQKITSAGDVPVYNNGVLIGARAKTQQEQGQGKPGWFDSFSGFFNHLLRNPVTNAVGEGGDAVFASFGNLTESNQQFQENATLMRSMGYDPSSQLSQIAFAAKGYERGDLAGVVKTYGQDQVTEAEMYLADPAKYVKDMIDAANKQDPTGKLASQQMQRIDSDQFGNVLKEVGGHQASLGTDTAGWLGLDPVKNPTAYGWTQGGVNFVASMVTDPTILLGKAYKLAKVASIGIEKGAADTSAFSRILDKANGNMFARQVQRGFQFAVDQGNSIREGNAAMQAAQDAGDLAGYAKAETQVANGFSNLRRVGLSELAPALLGHPVDDVEVLDKANPGLLKMKIGGEPLDTYDKLFDYVVHTNGMLALQSGRAFVESTLMPGAMSRFGSTWVRSVLNGTLTGRKTAYNLDRLEAATRLLPSATDAVEAATGNVIADAHTTEEAAAAADQTGSGLASQARAQASQFPSSEQLGEADYNLRRYGNFDGKGLGGLMGKPSFQVFGQEVTPGSWLNPSAVAARARLAATRLNVANVLPRNNIINLMDEQAPSKVYAFARTYLPQTQSSMLAASFAGGDIGTRRAILTGLKSQVMHAAGLGHSEAGREFMDGVLKDDAQVYSHSVDGTMDVNPWNGKQDYPAALWGGQNRLEYSIPPFAVMHQLAAKIGLHEAVLGRLMQSRIADGFSPSLRTSMLLTPRTAVRATVEGWVNMLARGDAGRALGAKATLADLEGGLPERSFIGRAVAKFPPTAYVGQWTRAAEKRLLTPEESEYLGRMADYPDVAHAVQDSMAQHLLKGDVNPAVGAHDALEIAKVGFQPSGWEKEGYSVQSTDGFAGAHRLEAALNLRQSQNPETFKALLDHIADPTTESRMRVLDAMKTPDEYRGFRASEWGNVFLDEDGKLQRAVTEDEKELALQQHATRLENDLRHLVTGRGQEAEYASDGTLAKPPVEAKVQSSLLDKMRGSEETPGEIPDGEWIHTNLTGPDRPLSAIAPTFIPKVVDDTDGIQAAWQKVGNALQDLTGNAYKMMVTRPAERMTSMPAFWGNYAKARVQMSDLESKLIEDGNYDKQTVDQLLMQRAIRQAWIRTEATVDDPGLKTQMDVVGRNFFAFPRAVNAFIRRYGQLVKQDPTVLRKGVLAIQSAEQAGVLYKDPNGELTYTVPGSSFLANALNELGRVTGFEKMVQLPTGDMTGKLLMSAPGFDNPVRPSMSPMLNIPFRVIANMVPNHREMMSEIDSVLNGSKGAGRSWESTLMPAAISHFWEALDPHERDNMVASATVGAFSNMVAADPNGEKGLWIKPGSDPSGQQVQQVLFNLNRAVRGQLFTRAILGMIAPGALSRPQDNFSGSQPDESYLIRGARSLDDEYKMMLNDFNGDYSAAQQAFLAQHPNGLIYTMPTTKVLGTDTSVQSTAAAEHFFETNYGLVEKYPNVLAYFTPSTAGKFDANAWQSQLALGIRQKKSVQDFVDSYELKVAQNQYFGAYDEMKKMRDGALAAGDRNRATFLSSDFKDQMAPFLAANPLLQDYLATGSAERASTARKGIDQLRVLLQDPAASGLTGLDQAGEMLQAWDTHQLFQNNRVNNTSAQRSAESAAFADYMTGIVSQNPNLTGLYAMFRALDNKVLPNMNTIASGG